MALRSGRRAHPWTSPKSPAGDVVLSYVTQQVHQILGNDPLVRLDLPDSVPGNPSAEVEVRAAPDGTITGKRLVKSSGNKAWDDAVLRAIDKTETLPRDTDGRVPPLLVISFRPKE